MSDKQYSWFDYANFGMTVALGVLAIIVTVKVSRSADDLGRSSLYVTMATFLLDDSPKRQAAGVAMVQWAFKKNPEEIPPWVSRYVGAAAQGATGGVSGQPFIAPSSSPSETSAGHDPDEVTPTAGASENKTADHLFDAVGGVLPRLFIQVPQADQEAGASLLRCVLNHSTINDQPIVTPAVQKVHAAPNKIELRFLTKSDASEAGQIATRIQGLIGSKVALSDLSERFSNRTDIKPRTYELWFPEAFAIKVAGGTTCT